MKRAYVWIPAGLAAAGGWLLVGMLDAGEVGHGPDVRTQFEQWRDTLGDHYLDFEDTSVPAGPLAPVELGDVTVTFTTTQTRYPSVENVSYPVSIIPFNFVTTTHNGTRTLMGTRWTNGLPDGQSRYEIVFSEPQARVGLMRMWNTNSLTRFYNPDGVLLGEHQNTANNEFVAWMAGGPDRSEWVSRVVMDGNNVGAYQVGETDEIFFGTRKPDGAEMIGLIYGPEALDKFTICREVLGDVKVDFEEVPSGQPLSSLEIAETGDTLTFKTTEKRYPKPPVAVDFPVSVLPYGAVNSPSGTHELMGASWSGGSPDGQNRYEIEFSQPQHRVGLMRRWNTASITRFLAEDGALLGEHQNTVNHEFVGWIGSMDAPGTWVKKVVIDGALLNNAYQVGCTDDLHFSRTLPNRERVRIRSVEIAPPGQITVQWEPAQKLHHMEISGDLHNWQFIEGQQLTEEQWSGSAGQDGPVFLRLVTEKLFP